MNFPSEAFELIKRSAKESLAVFTRLVWPLVNPGVEMKWNWHLDAICEHLEAVSERKIRSLLISLPPGSCKSTLVCQAWPCWEWLRYPERRWIFATNSLENARKEATYRRSILLSDLYDELEPLCTLQKSGKRIQVVRNTMNGEMRAISTGSSITGAHFDTQVIDDPNDAQRISPEELDAVNTWYDEVLSTRCRDNSATVLIQQRLAPSDLAGHLHEIGVDAEITLPALYSASLSSDPTPLGWKDPRTKEGQLLWPERQDLKFLKQRRKVLGPLAFSAQYQQRPSIEGGAVFLAKWWNRHEKGTIPTNACAWLMSVDTASSLRDGADLTVVQVWAMSEDGIAYLIEQQSGHWEITEQGRRVKNLLIRYPAVKKVVIEERNGGFALCGLLSNELPRMHRMLWRWKSQLPKVSRIESIAGIVENGQVSICTGEDGDLLISQASEFPAGRHDDAIDAATIVLDIWRRKLLGLGPVLEEVPSDFTKSNAVRISPSTSIRVGSSAFDKRLQRNKSKR